MALELLTVLLSIVAVVSVLLVLGTILCIDRGQLRELRADLRTRLRLAAPAIGLLVVVLVINSLTRRTAQRLSWLIGFEITDQIYRLEGAFVAWVQTFQTTELTVYFSAVYVYGYVFLLVFPLLAYFALSEQRSLHELTVAYTANYAIGLVCYLLFVAYGPRNLGIAEQFMYDVYPSSRLLTSAVNTPTNVFPSLHTSLSVTVLLFAWRTREAYPRWLAIAAILATSVVISTMYLGIHWLTDVIAGIGLASASYWIGVHGADRWRELVTGALPRITTTFRSRP
jgi:membrane-associated phospholipid phosphatase